MKEKQTVSPHYSKGNIEVWDFILDQKLDFIDGTILSYVCRAKHKGQAVQDYVKIIDYALKQIEVLTNKTGVATDTMIGKNKLGLIYKRMQLFLYGYNLEGEE